MYTHCVLCKTELKNHDNGWFYTMLCEGCEVDHMSKFQASYRKEDNKLIYMIWWIEDTYIKIDLLKEKTEVSKIDVVILYSTFTMNHILEVDHEDPSTTVRRINNLMVFS